MRKTLTPARLAKMLAGVTVLLIALNAAFIAYRQLTGEQAFTGLIAAIDYETQWNIGAIYQSLVLLLCSVAALFIGVEHETGSVRVRLGWLGFSAALAYLCIDGLFRVHEMIVPVLVSKMADGGLHLGWLGPRSLLFATLALVYLAFLYHLDRKTAGLLLLGSVLFVVGTMGIDLVAGWWNAQQGELLGQIVVALKEAIEMVGIAVIAPTALDALQEVDTINTECAAAMRQTHPRVAIGS